MCSPSYIYRHMFNIILHGGHTMPKAPQSTATLLTSQHIFVFFITKKASLSYRLFRCPSAYPFPSWAMEQLCQGVTGSPTTQHRIILYFAYAGIFYFAYAGIFYFAYAGIS